jgi:hypothetical protein
VLAVAPAPVEGVEVVVLVPLAPMLLLALPLVLGVSLRTCFVTLSQHLMLPGEVALGEVVVVDV